MKRNNVIYGNYRVLSPKGDLIFLSTKKRADWYLSRDLAKWVEEDPPTIQLTFVPNGQGQKDDVYSLGLKDNKCVVCAEDNLEVLTKHHIVPSEYRKHFPNEIKDHNSHDIVPICIDCHAEYEEKHANILKYKIGENYNAPYKGINEDKYLLYTACRHANLIKDKADQIPQERIDALMETIYKFYGSYDISREEMQDLRSIDSSKIIYTNTELHGQLVVSRIVDYQEFVETWRQDFVNVMSPKYLPDGWEVKRSVNMKS